MSSRLLGGTAYAAGVAIETSTGMTTRIDPHRKTTLRLWFPVVRVHAKACCETEGLRQPDSMSGGRGMMALEREMMSSGFTNNFGACHECSTLSSHIVLILRANCL